LNETSLREREIKRMHCFNDKIPVREWAGVLESMARQLGSMADYLAQISKRLHELDDVSIEISRVVKEGVSLVHEMPDITGKPNVLGILVHLEELFGLPQKIDGEIQEALGLVRDMPENLVANKLKVVRILEEIEYLLKRLNEGTRR
jgi:hypothetical protein